MSATPTGNQRRPVVAPLILAASQWLVGAVLAAILTLLFLAINAVQLSSEGTGERLLARSIAVSTEIDSILPDLQAGLREEAEATQETEIRVPDFPIPVVVTRDEASSLEGTALRERILDGAASRVYKDGMSAWSDSDPSAEQDIDRFSVAGAMDRGLGLITSENHNISIILAAVLGFLAFVLAAPLLSTLRSWARFIVAGVVLIVAALPSLAATIAARFAFRTAQEDADPFVGGLLELGVEAMWIPIRNYLALTVLGSAILLLTLIFIWISSRLETSGVEGPPAAPTGA